MDMKMKKIDAYFTVEAALVLPIVIAAILLTIYLFFFQYDRCLMEQNTGKLALRGCANPFADGDEVVKNLAVQSREKDERFLAWEMKEAQITFKRNRISVKREGNLMFPFRGLIFWNGSNTWSSECVYENIRVTPVQFIRNCRKIKGGK